VDPLYSSFVGAIARWVVTLAIGFLVAHHIIAVDQTAYFVDGFTHKLVVALPLLLPLGWSLWGKYKGRVRFLTALQARPGTTESMVNARIENGMGASVKAAGVILLACVLAAAAAFTMPSCASVPPAGTYSTAGLKAFNADQLLKDVTALSETAIRLNATSGPLHVKDRDTAIVRDFALSAGAGLVAYADGKGSLAVVVSAFDELTRKLSAEAALNDKLRYILALVADNIHRIPQ
jgi:hypothetical protein